MEGRGEEGEGDSREVRRAGRLYPPVEEALLFWEHEKVEEARKEVQEEGEQPPQGEADEHLRECQQQYDH